MASVKTRALKLLRSSSFFFLLLGAIRKTGLVGEKRNALVVYVVGTSRLLSKPLCLFVKGPSGIGKNFTADAVLGFFPPSEVQQLTSTSMRSWNYQGKKLAHKIIYVKERNDASGSVHPTRLLISEKELVHSVTFKKRGRFVTERRVTKGPIAAISTTTRNRVEVDDETRHISIWLDESPDQTRRIMEAAVEHQSPLGASERKVWQTVQRLIERRAGRSIESPSWFKDLVPYVRNDNLWARRYFSAFVQACKTVALIRSFRLREPPKKTITVRFSDFAITAIIFNPVFEESIDRADDEDLETQRHVRRIASRKGGNGGVRAAELAEEIGVSADQAYRLLRKAASAGTVYRVNQPSKGNLKLFLPAKPRPFLPDPAEVFRKLEGLPESVKFVHPLTGKFVKYARTKNESEGGE